MNNLFSQSEYIIRKKVFSVMGAKLHIYNSSEELVLYSQMKAFKLKEDIALYTDESMGKELLRIKARKMIDFSATYDVYDSETGETVGALRRKGLKSIVKDEWVILGPRDNELGFIKEDSVFMALLRRAIPLIPQKYNVELDGLTIPAFRQNFNPFVTKIIADFSEDRRELLDRRLGLAAAILLCAIEGKQD
ncbi:LURP-one-related family protein [Paenibacillus sp. MMS20-IR301]|uniref:LURP-one-related family protein n=1 Tax=Paenibacillus sp. MMS20-IR301 TaxID=2895946 RepID=UPI0028E93A10|nr:LURP-one-related family protein [Paenibacillus sp. MMS20-IR301]WNS46384.1 LURP-one-related family protein [Paenibacillus sp. MMS20-IR301]